MKLISLLASPRKEKGNTARLLRIVLEGAESLGAENETIFLPGGTVLPCRGCDLCHKKGRCPQEDDFAAIQEKILGADGLVLASPNYIFSVSAQLKAFMDRCAGVLHCLAFEGKYGASVVTSGGGDEAPIAEYMNYFLITAGVRPVGAVWATMAAVTGDAFPGDIRSRALDLGKKLVRSIQEKASDPEVDEKMAAFRARMRNLISWRRDEWAYEYEYWKKHHGMD